MSSIQQTSRIWLPILFLVAAGLIVIASGWQTSASEKFIQYGFSQTQTQLSVRVESSHDIKSSQWSYAGPLDNRSDCSNRLFGGLPEAVKGKANVTVSANNPKIGSAQLPIQRSDNNKYYCLIIEGYPTVRTIDYNSPTIRLESSNHLVGSDIGGLYGPSGNVDSKSWQAAVFDVSRQSDTYGCDATNSELNFRSTPAGIKHVGQYSHGNLNHVSYNVPDGYVRFIVEFFESLENALYAEPETNPALIPFVDGQYSEAFTDNIHLCHRVSDPQGNTTYKLMHLDLGGPAIKLTLTNGTLQASSPAVDLDDSTWQYYKLPHRRNKYICEYLNIALEPTGKTATVANVQNGDLYCFWALDKQGNRNTRLVEIKSGALTALPPTPVYQPPAPESDQEEQEQLEETEENVNPPVEGRQSTNDNTLTTAQQAYLDKLDNNNQIVPGDIDIDFGAEQIANQSQPPSTVEQSQSQVLSGEVSEPEPESEVALESVEDVITSASGQQLSQTDDETPGVFKYLIFILTGLGAVVVILAFIVLSTAPRK